MHSYRCGPASVGVDQACRYCLGQRRLNHGLAKVCTECPTVTGRPTVYGVTNSDRTANGVRSCQQCPAGQRCTECHSVRQANRVRSVTVSDSVRQPTVYGVSQCPTAYGVSQCTECHSVRQRSCRCTAACLSVYGSVPAPCGLGYARLSLV